VQFGKVLSNTPISMNVMGHSIRKVGEAITMVPQCNPKNYWLLLNDAYNSEILVYKVNGDTVTIDSAYPAAYYGTPYVQTFLLIDGLQMSFNPQGTKFAYDRYIYNFDRKTGVIALFDSLALDSSAHCWGISWSPNGKVLYRVENGLDGIYRLFQYDMESGANNRNRGFVAEVNEGGSALQLGIDGKNLYWNREPTPFIGNKPAQ